MAGNATQSARDSIEKYQNKPTDISTENTGAILKRRPWYRRFADAVVHESANNIMDYVIDDILIPTFIDAIVDSIKGAADMFFYGGRRTPASRRTAGPNEQVSYRKFSDSPRAQAVSQGGQYYEMQDIYVDSYYKADAAKSEILDECADGKYITVGRVYDIVGITVPFTYEQYGWRDLRDSDIRIRKARGGMWSLSMPKPEVLT